MQVIFYIENKKLQRKLKMSTFQKFQKYMYLYLQWIQKNHTVAFVRRKLNFIVLFTHLLFKYKMRAELIGIHN